MYDDLICRLQRDKLANEIASRSSLSVSTVPAFNIMYVETDMRENRQGDVNERCQQLEDYLWASTKAYITNPLTLTGACDLFETKYSIYFLYQISICI